MHFLTDINYEACSRLLADLQYIAGSIYNKVLTGSGEVKAEEVRTIVEKIDELKVRLRENP